MSKGAILNQIWIYYTATRPKFLTASIGPILAGSALAYAVTGEFYWGLFVLALLGTMFLHSGANVTNDYYDHKSGNDTTNKNLTPYSGGRRYIQNGILSAKATITEAIALLAAGAVIGIVILIITKSIFVLILGIIGLAGGFFYTAPPVKLGYRTFGEPVIAFLFGILPVSGAYYIQTGRLDWIVLMPAVIVGLLIFLIILINDFPDAEADSAVNKKTFVVRFGVARCIRIYKTVLVIIYIAALAGVLMSKTGRIAGLCCMLTWPLGIAAIKSLNKKELKRKRKINFTANQLTILLHLAGCLALSGGFVLTGIFIR